MGDPCLLHCRGWLLTCLPLRAFPCCMQGDVLSGCIATFAAWAQRAGGASKEQLHSRDDGGGGSAAEVPPLLLAAYAGCVTTRWVLA